MSPPAAMRGMLHSYGRKAMGISFAAAVGGTLVWFFAYTQPRHEKYEQYFKSYDPYTRMKEICAANKGYMHTCPQDLAKKYEEAGKEVASL
ncbi:unnamed protein product [Auanema sp. JU1783]|nr:unnamed protein product [Auanema sp. JU1783]